MKKKGAKSNDARNWLLGLTGFIVVFALLTAFAIISGVDSDELDTIYMEIEELEAQTTDVTDEEALAEREEHLSTVDGLAEQLQRDVTTLLTDKDFETFGKTYGQDIKVVIETEFANGEYSTVDVLNQPLLHADDSYPMSIVLDDTLHFFVYYDMETNELVPQYVHRESEGE